MSAFYDTPNGERIYLSDITEVTDTDRMILHGRATSYFLVCVRTSGGNFNEDIAVEVSARLPARYPRAKRLLTVLRHNRVWFTVRNIFGRKKFSAARTMRHAELYDNELRLQDEHKRKVAAVERELTEKVNRHRQQLISALANYYRDKADPSLVPEHLRDELRPHLIRQQAG